MSRNRTLHGDQIVELEPITHTRGPAYAWAGPGLLHIGDRVTAPLLDTVITGTVAKLETDYMGPLRYIIHRSTPSRPTPITLETAWT